MVGLGYPGWAATGRWWDPPGNSGASSPVVRAQACIISRPPSPTPPGSIPHILTLPTLLLGDGQIHRTLTPTLVTPGDQGPLG